MDTWDTLWAPWGKIHLHPTVLCNSKCLPNFCPIWPKAYSLMEWLHCLILFPALFYPWYCSCWPLPRMTISHFLFPFLTQFKCPFLREAFLGSPLCSHSTLDLLRDSSCWVMLSSLAYMLPPSVDFMLPEDRNLVLFYRDCGPCTWPSDCHDGWLSNVCPSLTCSITTGTGRGPHKGWPSCLPPSQPAQEAWRTLAGWLCVI